MIYPKTQSSVAVFPDICYMYIFRWCVWYWSHSSVGIQHNFSNSKCGLTVPFCWVTIRIFKIHSSIHIIVVWNQYQNTLYSACVASTLYLFVIFCVGL